MSLGNISSQVRNKPSYHAWIPIAFLPKEPMRVERHASISLAAQGIEARQSYHDILAGILKPITQQGSEGHEMFCADECVRKCYPVLSAWLADHEENALIHSIKNNVCPTCTCPNNKLGDWSSDDMNTSYPKRDPRVYIELTARQPPVKEIELNRHGIKRIRSVLWQIPNVRSTEIVRADLLHNVYLGILKHLMTWIEAFLKRHRRQDRFNDIWETLPPYPDFIKPTTSYSQISQWQGKEMRNFGRVILACFAAAICPTVDEVCPPTDIQAEHKKALTCVAALIDFHLMAQYREHNTETLEYLRTYLKRFHDNKSVFLEYRVGKRGKKKMDAVLGAERQATLEQEAHFNFPKMHLLLHYHEQIREYGELVQYSTEVSESMHGAFKDAYRRSNKNDALVQILDTYTRQHIFEMHEQNLKEWHLERDLGEEVIQVLARTHGVGVQTVRDRRRREELLKERMSRTQDDDDDDEPPASVKMEMQGRIPAGQVNTIQTLTTEYNILRLENDVWMFYKREYKLAYQRGVKIHEIPAHLPSDLLSLRTYHLEAFNTISLPVVDFQNNEKFTEHKMRATGPKSFRNQGSRSDWVWVKVSEKPNAAKTINGRLPARLNAIFKLKNHLESWRLAHVTLLHGLNGNYQPQGPEEMTRVCLRTSDDCSRIVRIRDILGMAHLIPIGNDRYIVNDRIDLTTWADLS